VQNTQQKAKGTKVVRLPFAFGYAPLLLTMLAKAKDAKAKGAKVVTLACYPGGNGGLELFSSY
jgi:hypothetical protein